MHSPMMLQCNLLISLIDLVYSSQIDDSVSSGVLDSKNCQNYPHDEQQTNYTN